MPSLNQDFTRFEHDQFVLRFTVTDAVTTLGNSNYAAWWGMANGTTAADTLEIEGWTTNLLSASPITAYNVSVGASDCSASGADPLTPGVDGDVKVKVYDYYVEVTIDFDALAVGGNDITNGSYYHELVLMPMVTNVAYQCRSTVAATGILTVKDSQYTNYSYR